MGDMHYASDVLVGAVVGTSVGLGVPLLHHYSGHEEARGSPSAVTVRFVPIALGGAIQGSF